jgi:hypothetical protein
VLGHSDGGFSFRPPHGRQSEFAPKKDVLEKSEVKRVMEFLYPTPFRQRRSRKPALCTALRRNTHHGVGCHAPSESGEVSGFVFTCRARSHRDMSDIT